MFIVYMEFSEFFPDYPRLDSADFSTVINKREFDLDYKAHRAGEFFPHQLFMQRFFSGFTPYRKMLVSHAVGLGKTALSLSVAESVRTQKAFPFDTERKKTLIIVKNADLEKTFQLELLNMRLHNGKMYRTCPVDESFLPDDKQLELESVVRLSSMLHKVNADNLRDVNTQLEKLGMDTYNTVDALNRSMSTVQRLLTNKRNSIHRVGLSNISQYYEVVSINRFVSKTLNVLNESTLVERYSNSVIIVDEVHNIRQASKAPVGDENAKVDGFEETSDESAEERYDKLHNFLQSLKNSYILLLSATPMVDKAHELAYPMNLILPMDQQLPNTESGFSALSEDDLKRRLRGRVSFLHPHKKTSATKTFRGSPHGHFTLFDVPMSQYQSEAYLEARGDDESYTLQNATNVIPTLNIALPERGLSEVFGQFNRDVKHDIAVLKRYSATYGALVEYLMDESNTKKKAFVFCQNINLRGVKDLVKILKQFGFSNYKKKAVVMPRLNVRRKKKRVGELAGKDYMRFAVLDTGIDEKKRLFNGVDNIDGSKIRLVIGSPMVSEGHSLMHVRSIHVMAPWWNHTRIEQVVGRGVRALSHAQLPPEERTVDIFLYNPKLQGGEKTFYGHMYEVAERKDLAMRRVIRLLKTESIDCENAKVINISTEDVDGSRVCDYTRCNYNCSIHRGEPPLTQDSYNLFYSSEKVELIMADIVRLYRVTGRFSFSLDELVQLTGEDRRLVLFALDRLTELKTTHFRLRTTGQDIRVIDKNGFRSYIRESNDVFYLTPDLSVDDPAMQTYSHTLVIKNNISLADALDLYEMETDLHKLQQAKEALDEGDADAAESHISRMGDTFKSTLRELIPDMTPEHKSFFEKHIGRSDAEPEPADAETVTLYGKELRGIMDGDDFKIFSYYNFKKGEFVRRKRDTSDRRGIVCTSLGKNGILAILKYLDAESLTDEEYIAIYQAENPGKAVKRNKDGNIVMATGLNILCRRLRRVLERKGLMVSTSVKFRHIEDERTRPRTMADIPTVGQVFADND